MTRSAPVLVVVLAAAFVVLSPSPAAASVDPEPEDFELKLAGVLVGGPLSLGMIGVDIAYAVDDRWLPPGWAVTQLALGIFDVVAGFSFYDSRQDPGSAEVGLVLLGLGTWFIGHAIASLVLDDYERPPTRYRQTAW